MEEILQYTLEDSLLCFLSFPLLVLLPLFLKKFQLSAGFNESEPLSAPCNYEKNKTARHLLSPWDEREMKYVSPNPRAGHFLSTKLSFSGNLC